MSSGDTTTSSLSSLYPLVYNPSQLALRAQNVMVNTATVFEDMLGKGIATRTFSQHAAVSATSQSEDADLTSTNFTKSSTATITPVEIGEQIVLTDPAVDTDPGIVGRSGMELGRAMGTKVDADLAALFSSFTGGTIGTTSAALTFTQLMSGKTILNAAGVYEDLWAVLHPFVYAQMASGISLEASMKNTPEIVKDELARQWYVGSIGGVNILLDPNIGVTSGHCVNGLYPSSALAFDVRRSYRVEEFRSPHGRKTEFNATMMYAVGVPYPARGVQLVSTAPTPS